MFAAEIWWVRPWPMGSKFGYDTRRRQARLVRYRQTWLLWLDGSDMRTLALPIGDRDAHEDSDDYKRVIDGVEDALVLAGYSPKRRAAWRALDAVASWTLRLEPPLSGSPARQG